MISTKTFHIASRVFRELRRDVRTMFLFIISPTFVMVLTAGILHGHQQTFDRIGLIVLGLFPTAPTFLFAAFAVQRERYRGNLECLMTTPVSRLDVLFGYILGFTLPALVQIGATLGVTYGLLDLHAAGAWWVVGLLALLSSVLGVTLGLFSANLAHNELQLTKVLAATAAPHLMLSGLFRPHDQMVGWMRALSDVAPWRYAVAAVAELQDHAVPTGVMWVNLGGTVAIIVLLSTIISGTVLRRQTA
jgi:ABC-2 type transport system permease protein